MAAGNDTLGLMPTGGGKSICFQVPALAVEGICLVITPLIALMKDQVENLVAKGIKAAAIYSGMHQAEINRTLNNCIYGNYKFLYISPERLKSPVFLQNIHHLNINLLAIDESHCISQWGYDFRPSYLQIAEIRELIPNVPVLALTATATQDIVTDIQQKLHFKNGKVFKKSFERKNLAYVVRETDDKPQELLKILNNVQGTSVIYVRSRNKTKQVAEFLNENNIKADYFHAGLNQDQKNKKQQDWKTNQIRVIVATNAFGMGIDKPDVRTVIHIDIPDSIEAYFQEAGRAGRDEKKAYAIMLYNKGDIKKLKKRIADNFPPKGDIINVYEKLAYYYQVGTGYGMGRNFEFNLGDFCSKYKLSLMPTHSALQILTIAGYIEYTDELEMHSRVIFFAYRDELYKYNLGKKSEDIIAALLRNYTGLFADFVRIDEQRIASQLNIKKIEVIEILVHLSKQKFIKYIPYTKSPFIVYTQNREQTKYLAITKQAYDNRKDRYINRIEAIVNYATDTNTCRSRMLLNYFSQADITDCGVCDICINKKKQGTFISTQSIINELKHKNQTVTELDQTLNTKSQQIIT